MFVDPRGQRFAAALTTVLLALTLLTGSPWLLALQGVVFALSVFRGLQATPYAWLFRRLVRPRLAPPAELEDARPVRFAQAMGLGFVVVGLIGAVTGVTALFLAATGLALVAAFLNAAFGFCLGCEVYLIIRRFIPTREEIPA
jgi:predicted lipid-binding transport protein (Tim44 family)